MKILVLGAPFSGLKCMFNMLQAAGYKVGFEKPGPDGMVRTLLAEDLFYAAGYSRIYHVVCNPLSCIAAISKNSKFKKHQLFTAVDIWIKSNNRCKSFSDETARIEFIKADWPTELFRPKKYSRFKNDVRPLTIKKMKEMGDLGTAALDLAKQYRYEL